MRETDGRALNAASSNGKPPGETALESVRRLEETLEGKRELQAAVEGRLKAAREEAGRIVREAREEARRTLEERRGQALAAADEEAARVLAGAEATAEDLRALAAKDRPEAVRAVVGHVLPARGRGG
ncbi:hypothetical protein GBA65_07515 [Rubrobacter marinus]|uniref:Uncharacterized protein n=1 Tax=Rubrobacter marinus TaxID=2653852 RepID=A0A6G8PW23_9ACTN|nr:hypothetical protein [Rubrobacter marinus]QIN78396.1 hypothetical protein GBA65_07515 [Rubrobacter marinus]